MKQIMNCADKLEEQICYFLVNKMHIKIMDLVSVKVVNQVRSHAEGQLKNQVSSQVWEQVRQKTRNYEEFRY
jgi:hypothetical protein